MKFPTYKHAEAEPEILAHWDNKQIVESLRERNKNGQKFYFLEGPPYTSGQIHLGHAWNMALKDIILRYKRMRGYNVWDRMGYDMHGLPTEQKTMKKLGLENKEDILKFGLKKFMVECELFCTEMMEKMDIDFARLGATLDFTNPYRPITQEFMEAEWWLIKTAYEKDRVYQGLRTMHWDAATQTAVAKHELEYRRISDTSIYVKFQHKDNPQKFFIIWTTTPWTIPLNLAVMVNPELAYVEVEVNGAGFIGETWILVKSRAEIVLEKAGIDKDEFKIIKEVYGKELAGQQYIHPLNTLELLPKDLQENPGLFTVLLSTEYVDDSAGTGLVHTAPGCGPEDYEVGYRNGIPPFNCVDEAGYFENFGKFTGWKAKSDDKKFIEALDQADAIVGKEPYAHDYPYGERSHEPVIFRTTKQWFFKVEDLKEKMLKANEEILWNPITAKHAFRSWLENLRDNSITKQRYWGTPVPIWQAEDGDVIVVGSVEELEKLSGEKIEQMHIPEIDQIVIEKNGKIYKRIPDVLDVWIDAGTASWNCLDYPRRKDLLEKLFPADFILEGKDQIRGWFNLLMVASFLSFDKPSFKNVYMNGFVTDVHGVKMSKSLGNIISPYELIEKHGADVLRYYMCQTNAGQDINFSWDECIVKERQLLILWNVHKLLISLSTENEINPFKLDNDALITSLQDEEKYILSKLNSTIKKVTNLLEEYRIDEIISPLENLFLELSRTYIQIVRDKSSIGTRKEKEVVLHTLGTVVLECLKMLHIVTPFICEVMYLNLKEEFGLKEDSLSHYSWPEANLDLIQEKLELNMDTAGLIIQAALSGREKAKRGLRWPISEIVVVSSQDSVWEAVDRLKEILMNQINTKNIKVVKHLEGTKVTLKPNHAKLGPAFGKNTRTVIEMLATEDPEKVMRELQENKEFNITVSENTFTVTPEMIAFENDAPKPFVGSDFKGGQVYVNTELSPELEAEGFAREVMRQVQECRKKAGLQKTDRISLFISSEQEMVQALQNHENDIKEKVGSEEMVIVSTTPEEKYEHQSSFSVKGQEFKIWFNKQ
ncbi:MAG: isoleucine--tRNA ligase [archaeon]|nr:isoleucine--tRNA ligase [archaeon]